MNSNHNMDFSSAPAMTTQRHNDDIDDLRDYLVDTLEAWLPRVLPGGRVVQGRFVAGSLAGEPGKSLKVRLTGDRRGQWIDFATGEYGNVFSLLQGALNVRFPDAVNVARGMRGNALPEERPVPRPTPSKHKADPDGKKAVQFILSQCHGMRESFALRYLTKGRGLSLSELPADLLDAPVLKHAPSGFPLPTMVALVRDIDGNVTGVHRTFLDPHLPIKAMVDQNKMMLGQCSGGAVRLSHDIGEHLGVAEGIETALSAMQITGIPTWATLSTSGMRNVVIPADVKIVTIFADNDPPIYRPNTPMHGQRPGYMAAMALAERLRQEGRVVEVRFPSKGKDFNDELRTLLKGEKSENN